MIPRRLCCVVVSVLVAMSAGEWTVSGQTAPQKLDPVVVTATRAPQPPEQVPFALKTFDGDALRATPAATLDGALRSVPGFSLFRRSDSLTANPTAQGVSLRGLGPSGASRSLVLLDGVPLNDPFGGWVAWSKAPRESLARAELVRGGGATAWGNAALGGVVQLFTEPAAGESMRLTATVGDFDTRGVEARFTHAIGRGTLQLLGRDFTTDGFATVAPERRGPVDMPAGGRHHWLTARWRQPVGASAELTFTGRVFSEKRANGTPYQRNSSRETFGAATLTAQPNKTFTWTTTVHAQDQSFASTFSSINTTRTAETPASDQFDVPAKALGAAWTGTWIQSGSARTSAGADLRGVRGETRENFTFTNGSFTRLRIAGGGQTLAGAFALHERPLAADLRLTLGARFDFWRETDGHRRETDRATGAVLRDDHYADRDGAEFSPSAGLVWQPAKAWRVRAAAQQAFRRPTLNELYRPFRQGSNITETNPELRTEHVTSAELGADYTREAVTLGAALFWNELRDAVGNITLARGPGNFPLFGAIPAGGVGRQRLNLDRTRVRGLELSATWRPAAALTLTADYLYDDATVRRASVALALEGRRLAQVPRHNAVLGATWRAPGGIAFTPRLRWIGAQFEDDENQLRLGEAVIFDCSASYSITRTSGLFVTIENLGNARLETGRSADGVVNTGTPRFAFGGLRWAW